MTISRDVHIKFEKIWMYWIKLPKSHMKNDWQCPCQWGSNRPLFKRYLMIIFCSIGTLFQHELLVCIHQKQWVSTSLEPCLESMCLQCWKLSKLMNAHVWFIHGTPFVSIFTYENNHALREVINISMSRKNVNSFN